jgi:hypothetical protein
MGIKDNYGWTFLKQHTQCVYYTSIVPMVDVIQMKSIDNELQCAGFSVLEFA